MVKTKLLTLALLLILTGLALTAYSIVAISTAPQELTSLLATSLHSLLLLLVGCLLFLCGISLILLLAEKIGEG
jgi:hypothetical protein